MFLCNYHYIETYVSTCHAIYNNSDIHTQLFAPVPVGETAKIIVSSSQVILVPLSLLALRNERVEMMKLN